MFSFQQDRSIIQHFNSFEIIPSHVISIMAAQWYIPISLALVWKSPRFRLSERFCCPLETTLANPTFYHLVLLFGIPKNAGGPWGWWPFFMEFQKPMEHTFFVLFVSIYQPFTPLTSLEPSVALAILLCLF